MREGAMNSERFERFRLQGRSIPAMIPEKAWPGLFLIAFLLAGALPASGATSKIYRLRFEGKQSKQVEAKGQTKVLAGNYTSVHLIRSSGKSAYGGRFFSSFHPTRSASGGEETPLEEIPPGRPALLEGDYSPRSGNKDNENVSIEAILAMEGFRELVLLPDRKYKKGESFRVEFKANYGTFASEYKVTGTCKIQKKTCVIVQRTVSLVKAKPRISLKVESWEEEIAFETRMGIPLRRKLHYVLTATGQRGETSFEAEATEVKKLQSYDYKKEEKRWAPAFALKKALDQGMPDPIRESLKAIGTEGDFAPLARYADHIAGTITARLKVQKGLTTQKMEERSTHYCLYVPKDYDPAEKYGLVLALHGAGGRALPMAQVWMPFADENKAVVLAPKSSGSSWNTGSDVTVIRQALGEVVHVYSIDEKKIAVFGFSAGAALSYVVHFFMEGFEFRAVIPVCGHMQMAKVRTGISKELDTYKPKMQGRHFYLLTGERDHCRAGVKGDKSFLEKQGAKVEFKEVPGMGHTFSVKLMPPIYEWLLEAFKGE